MNKSAIDAVLFDLDGVLIDSGPAHLESWRRLAMELGIAITDDQFKSTFGRQNRDVIPMLFGPGNDPERMHEWSERKEAYYRELIADRVPIFVGATGLVRACHRAGMKCAIGSSGHPKNIALAVAALRIETEISVVVSGQDVSAGKPDPQVFLLGAERLGVSAARCAVIEDAPAGIAAALNAGMTAIAVASEHPREHLNRAHLIVDRLSDLTPARIGGAAQQRWS
ncbi:MAG: HAD family phosphatase [Phycisphaerales bacterium]|nr:HAD family phosphatase [Phycisphaerales bacterium]